MGFNPLKTEKKMRAGKFISVLIVDQAVERKGILANAAFVVGLTAGRELPQSTFGSNVVDGEGAIHRYLRSIGHIVRKAGQSKMRSIRALLVKSPDVLLVDYTEDAAPVDYDSYSRSLAEHSGEDIKYRAIYVYGPEESVIPLTKNLSRLE
jgi:hypothetical protein